MTGNERFQDGNKRGSDFYSEVWVRCPICQKKGVANADYSLKKARLVCYHCSFNKEIEIRVQMPAHLFFDAELLLQAPFKNEVFYAYNKEHLDYLEQYIGASIREHKDRTHFTLLEKLPKFYHESKNRNALLKLIDKLKLK